MNLRVPSGGKWIPASEACLSAWWRTELAGGLAELIERGGPVSDALAQLESKLVDPPDQRPFSVESIGSWRKFLVAIGVRDGLWPQAVPRGSESREGRELSDLPSLARRFGLSAEDAERWIGAVQAEPNRFASHPYTSYRPTRPVTVLPGQDDYGSLDDRTRSVWARLVVAGLEEWATTALEVTWSRYLVRHRNDRDAMTWPSPIQAFLAETEWLPITEPGERRDEVFVCPYEAWFYLDTVGDRPPQFSPLVSTRVRRRLSDSPIALEAMKNLGLGDWLDPTHCPELLRHLASLLEDDRLPESGQWPFRNALLDAWSRASEWDAADFAEAMAETPLVVKRAGAVGTLSPGDLADAGLYVVPTGRSFATRILEAGGLPLLTVNDADVEAVASLLAGLAGEQVRTAARLDRGLGVGADHAFAGLGSLPCRGPHTGRAPGRPSRGSSGRAGRSTSAAATA